LAFPAAIVALLSAAVVIVAQVQMGRAWRIGVRGGDAPLFVSHGLFRFSRNPIFVGMMTGRAGRCIGIGALVGVGITRSLYRVVRSAGEDSKNAHLEASFGQSYLDFARL
jgi:protein-S-isoprenylcysteine O-methyltransferase Ste14